MWRLQVLVAFVLSEAKELGASEKTLLLPGNNKQPFLHKSNNDENFHDYSVGNSKHVYLFSSKRAFDNGSQAFASYSENQSEKTEKNEKVYEKKKVRNEIKEVRGGSGDDASGRKSRRRSSRSDGFWWRHAGEQQQQRQAVQCSAITCYNGGECAEDGVECRCPMGVSGKHCETETSVRFPRFFGKGFIEFPAIVAAERNFDIRVQFKPEAADGLLLFTAEHPNAVFDYFSVSLIAARVDFRFDCGSGVAIMRSEQKVRMREWNEVFISRDQRHAFIQLNGGKKSTGKSKGQFTRTNLQRHLFVGGHKSVGVLRDRTGVAGGFHGCVRRLSINAKDYDMRKGAFVGDALAGFNVEECGTEACKLVECLNGGQCLTEDADTPVCVCPLGSSGTRCQHKIDLAVPMFTGSSSFLQYTGLQRSVLSYAEIQVTFKPTSPDGLIMYNGYAEDKTGDFLSLAMKAGFVEHRFDLGSGPAVMRSRSKPRLNEWHVVRVWRTGRSGMMQVDQESMVDAMASGAFTQLTLTLDLFVGGHRNFDEVASHAAVNKSFEGCIQKLVVNERPMKMLEEAITGLNVRNCEHACSSRPCAKEGRCIAQMKAYVCSCPLSSTGPHCMQKLDFSAIKTPSFSRNSFLFYTNTVILKRISGRETKVQLRVNTSVREGLILWACEEELGPHGDFFSIGVHEGFLQVAYNLGSGDVRGVLNSTRLDDGKWHSIKIHRHDRKCYGSVDGERLQLMVQSPGDMRQLTNLASLYIGGMDEVSLGTQQQYKEGFQGCLSQLTLDEDYEVEVVKAAVDGANLKHCPA